MSTSRASRLRLAAVIPVRGPPVAGQGAPHNRTKTAPEYTYTRRRVYCIMYIYIYIKKLFAAHCTLVLYCILYSAIHTHKVALVQLERQELLYTRISTSIIIIIIIIMQPNTFYTI